MVKRRTKGSNLEEATAMVAAVAAPDVAMPRTGMSDVKMTVPSSAGARRLPTTPQLSFSPRDR